MKRNTALEIAQASAPKALTPEHKRFQNLLAKIAKAKQRLQDWQAQLPVFARSYTAQVEPIAKGLADARRAWAFELEQHLLGGKWARQDSQTLARMIADTAGSLVNSVDDAAEHAALKALHDRHAQISFDEAEQQRLLVMKALVESATGVDLGEEPVDSVDEMLQRARAQLQQDQSQTQAQAQVDEAAQAAAAWDTPPGRGGPKAQTAAQRQAESDAALVSQTVRAVYRKLAAALHPDRVDAAASVDERAQRTELMASANAAYAAGDLLALLSLQLQIEQVDLAHAAQVTAAQVRHFNRVLAEQLEEIEAEISDREEAFSASYGIVPNRRPDPNKLGVWLKDEARRHLTAEMMLQMEQRHIRSGGAIAKAYLKQERSLHRDMDRFDRSF